MKRLYVFCVCAVMLMFFAGCSNEGSGKELIDGINGFLTDHFDRCRLDSLNYIIIIPNQGCAGCVNVAELFYRDFSERNDILFIFSNIQSVKMLHHKISVNNANTIIDTANVYLNMFQQKEAIYPTAIVMKDGSASAILMQSPRQPGLRVIRNHLEQKLLTKNK